MTASQVASIPNDWWFNTMTSELRASLTASQVQSLNIPALGIASLTASQIGALSETQVRQVRFQEFQFLTPRETAMLTNDQIASIDNEWHFERMSAESRGVLSPSQIRSLNVDAVGIAFLTPPQISLLTTDQLQQVDYRHFGLLTTRESQHLTADQIGSIENAWWFEQMSSEVRASLSREQVQGLNVQAVGVALLTPSQIASLTDSQVQQVNYRDFQFLSPREIALLTPAEIASIENEWWFEQIPSELRALLTPTQVQAVNVPAVGIEPLTTEQIGQLTQTQLQQVGFRQFGRLGVHEVAFLTPQQIASIESEWWFDQMAPEVRAALSPEQVRALNTATISLDFLTSFQRSQLAVEQIQSVRPHDFRHLTPSQVVHVTGSQLASVTNVFHLKAMTEEGRAAFTREQLSHLSAEILAESAGLFPALAS